MDIKIPICAESGVFNKFQIENIRKCMYCLHDFESHQSLNPVCKFHSFPLYESKYRDYQYELIGMYLRSSIKKCLYCFLTSDRVFPHNFGEFQ